MDESNELRRRFDEFALRGRPGPRGCCLLLPLSRFLLARFVVLYEGVDFVTSSFFNGKYFKTYI